MYALYIERVQVNLSNASSNQISPKYQRNAEKSDKTQTPVGISVQTPLLNGIK